MTNFVTLSVDSHFRTYFSCFKWKVLSNFNGKKAYLSSLVDVMKPIATCNYEQRKYVCAWLTHYLRVCNHRLWTMIKSQFLNARLRLLSNDEAITTSLMTDESCFIIHDQFLISITATLGVNRQYARRDSQPPNVQSWCRCWCLKSCPCRTAQFGIGNHRYSSVTTVAPGHELLPL